MDYDLIIIGSGPAGYVAAIRAGQVGLKTLVIEKSKIGGMCLNWGCVPTKALLESAKLLHKFQAAEDFGIEGFEKKDLALNWSKVTKRAEKIVKKLSKGIEFLFKKNGVEMITGNAKIVSPNSVSVDNRTIEATNILLATGSKPLKLEIEGIKDKKIELNTLLILEKLPGKPVVLGNGPVAIEIAQMLSFAGKEVILVTADSDFLAGSDPYISKYVQKILKKSNIRFFTNSEVSVANDGKLKIGEEKFEFDAIINGSNREAVLPESDIELKTENGFVKVNEYLQTNYESIFAVGDVNGLSMLAHAASSQGLHAVNFMQGIKNKIDLTKIPLNMYTSPEIAQVGLTEPQVDALNIKYKVSEFPLSANSKAMIEGDSDGLIRLISDEKYGEVLGVQIIAQHATDMIAEAAALMSIEGTVFDLGKVIHAHPTTSEIYLEAGFAAIDKAIHM